MRAVTAITSSPCPELSSLSRSAGEAWTSSPPLEAPLSSPLSRQHWHWQWLVSDLLARNSLTASREDAVSLAVPLDLMWMCTRASLVAKCCETRSPSDLSSVDTQTEWKSARAKGKKISSHEERVKRRSWFPSHPASKRSNLNKINSRVHSSAILTVWQTSGMPRNFLTFFPQIDLLHPRAKMRADTCIVDWCFSSSIFSLPVVPIFDSCFDRDCGTCLRTGNHLTR